MLDLCRSSYYYQCCPETEENLALMRLLDELHLEHPVYGSRKLAVSLRREGLVVNRKRVVRLLRLMGIEAIYAKPKTSLPAPGHQIYPYLLRDLVVTGSDQVWCADITYVPMARGFMYLVPYLARCSPGRCRDGEPSGAAGAGKANLQAEPRAGEICAD